MVQLLVVAIAGFHDGVEGFGIIRNFGMLYFVPISLFLVPTIYAALSFGLQGSLATAVWCSLITVPNWVLWHTGLERWGVIVQMAAIDGFAVFAGRRVDQEREARATAQLAERKYRALFDSSAEAVLVVERNGRVIECNAVAALLLGASPEHLSGRSIDDVLPTPLAAAIRTEISGRHDTDETACINGPGGRPLWVKPVSAAVATGGDIVEVVLRDLTQEKLREMGLEAYVAENVRSQEKERADVARELHDLAVQALVALGWDLDAIRHSASTLPDPASDEVQRARGRAVSIVENLRQVIRGLRPPVLDDLGLAAAVRGIVADLGERASLQAEVLVRGEKRRLAAEEEVELFRIAQEALANVERHAAARRVTVNLNYGSQEIELTVADDGRGFVMPHALADFQKDNKFGLIGMQERARMVGGKLTVRTLPRAGTTVVVTVPVAPEHRARDAAVQTPAET